MEYNHIQDRGIWRPVMRITNSNFTVLVIMIALFLLGCVNSASPVIPGMDSSSTRNPVDISEESTKEILWGFYDVFIEPVDGSVEIVPLRGVMFEANVTKFLQPPAGPGDMLSIFIQPETDFPSGYVVVNVGIQHPFPSTNLMGFDVMGIFIAAEGDQVGSFDPTLTWSSHDQARLLNADGYTRWWNQAEFTSYDTIFGYTEGAKAPHIFSSTSKLNPFKYFANGLEPDDPWDYWHLMETDRGSFDTLSPGYLERRYEIQFPEKKSPDLRFKYGITSSYVPPFPGSAPPAGFDDFPLTANRPEAAQIAITDTGSSAFYYSPTHYGGDLSFELAITDWQGGGTLTGTMGEFMGIYAESPTLFDGSFDLMEFGEYMGEPYNATFFIWCYLPDVNPTTVAHQELLITVVSKYPNDYSVQHPGGSGFDYPEGVPLAAYNIWDVPIQGD